MPDITAKMHKIQFAPDSTGEGHTVPTNPLAVFKGGRKRGSREGKRIEDREEGGKKRGSGREEREERKNGRKRRRGKGKGEGDKICPGPVHTKAGCVNRSV